MDKLWTLAFVGKVSVCSKSVRVTGQVIGANVLLTVDQNTVGGGVATFTNQAFPVDLKGLKNKTLVAIQTLSGYQTSDQSATTIGGEPTPASLAQGGFFTPVHVCGTCVFVTGLFPGATVDVDSTGGAHGSAVVNEYGCARVDLSQPLAVADVLSAVQTACGVSSGAKIAGPPSPQPMPSALPAPTIGALLVCGQTLSVKNVTPGAVVTITRGKVNSKVTQQLWQFCAPIPEFPLYPIQPLAPDDEISIAVDFATCGHGHQRTLHAESKTAVLDMPPGAPQIAPLCGGDKMIALSALQAGATVKLTFNGGTVVGGAPGSSMTCKVPAGVQSASVTAQQSLCADVWGPLATKKVTSSTPVKPDLLSPQNKLMPPVPPQPTLKWKDGSATTSCSYPDEYRVQVVEDADHKASGFAKATTFPPVKIHQVVPPTKLKSGVTYHWRVQAKKGSGVSDWSVAWVFAVQDTAAPVDSTPDPHDQPGTWWFLEDCCAGLFYRQTIPISGTSYQDVLMKLVAMNDKPSACHIYEPGSSKWFPPGKCGEPNPIPPP